MVAAAIGWNGKLLKHLAYARRKAVVIFNEGQGTGPDRFVVFYGGQEFHTVGSLDDVVHLRATESAKGHRMEFRLSGGIWRRRMKEDATTVMELTGPGSGWEMFASDTSGRTREH
ncbi:hypothetical protein F5880DRAFT_1617623 [Lentinula raphanica]|nr:hypothetical protein F5880DRAFT_1617623 [Lentinula raphanica]